MATNLFDFFESKRSKNTDVAPKANIITNISEINSDNTLVQETETKDAAPEEKTKTKKTTSRKGTRKKKKEDIKKEIPEQSEASGKQNTGDNNSGLTAESKPKKRGRPKKTDSNRV
jgi:Rod binding domain-containing protein